MTFQTFMLAIGLMLVLEGIGPCLFPNKWRAYMLEISQQNQRVLQRIGGSILVSGIVLLIIFS
ncbi:DUF2065 domain-containing protein [Shewanella gelidii]|uniref:DUF2065 domain-containing protein n=1 Tax=Shewanella gelidii TaxID=1642821 RepID=A0A917NB05_9GAMM|nr:DUF2065 domain-containing protein [Shewanella gelidii]MCL1097700.1 DUF2065 domain-containing protein [Shewanella gelidii]GGI79450.1 hypothetical protein GCM10009332_16070 [Shewanella gelidii]